MAEMYSTFILHNFDQVTHIITIHRKIIAHNNLSVGGKFYSRLRSSPHNFEARKKVGETEVLISFFWLEIGNSIGLLLSPYSKIPGQAFLTCSGIQMLPCFIKRKDGGVLSSEDTDVLAICVTTMTSSYAVRKQVSLSH